MSPSGGLMPMAPTSTRCERSAGAMLAISAAIQPPKPRPTSAGVRDLQLAQQAAIDHRDVAHAAHPVRPLRAAVAGMVRHQHVVVRGQGVVEGQAVQRAGLVMQHHDGPALAGARQMQLGAGRLDRGVGPVHSRHSGFPSLLAWIVATGTTESQTFDWRERPEFRRGCSPEAGLLRLHSRHRKDITVLKLGYKASAEQFAPGKAARLRVPGRNRRASNSVFVSDHFQPWKHTDGHAPYSLAWLGALGARTSRVVIGTSVLTPTFRYHPSIVAQAFGTLGAMFPGRVILGIGTGESLNEVPSTGQPWPEFKERFARMREAVTLIRKLWREERVSFEGEYYKTEKATIYDRPDSRGADLRGRRRRAGGALCRPHRRRLHLHQRQEVGPLHRDAAAQGRRGHRRRGRAQEAALRPHDRGQGVVRHRRQARAARTRGTGRRWR